ncbi:hypothetical protein SB767_29845, partial [Bacillus sp. SIMBA_069]
SDQLSSAKQGSRGIAWLYSRRLGCASGDATDFARDLAPRVSYFIGTAIVLVFIASFPIVRDAIGGSWHGSGRNTA